MTQVVTTTGQTVDQIAHAHYGTTLGATEAILEANPGLAALGPVLPAGVTVTLPQWSPPIPDQGLRLWD